MRILRARIPDYGPLHSVELELAPGLNVVYGRNESGKTTLLDFLTSQLFRWERRRGARLETVLGDLDRFGDPSEAGGSVELRLGGEVVDYPDGPSLLHHLGLEHAGLAGLFCVRSGELELPEKEEGEFWAELKKVLSGLPQGVETLQERAREAAGLTPTTGELSDRGDPGRRTRYRELQNRIEALRSLGDRLEEVSSLADEIAGLEQQAEALEAARRARIARLRGELEAVREELEEGPEIPDGALDRWEELDGERERLREAAQEARAELREAEEKVEEREDRAEEIEGEAATLTERVRQVEERELESRARQIASETRPGPLDRIADPAYWVGVGLLVAGIGVVFFTPSTALRRPAWILTLMLVLAAGGGLLWLGRTLRNRRGSAGEELAALREDAAACGVEEEDPSKLPDAVRALEKRAHGIQSDLEGARARAESATGRRDEKRQELERYERRLEEVERKIADLQEELPFEDLEEARRRLERQRTLEDRKGKLTTALQELAGLDESAWEVEAPGRDDLPEWDATRKSRVDEQLEQLRAEHRELRREFDRAGLETPEDAVTELEQCRRRVREIELDRDAGRLAAEIFGTMDAALEERLSDALRREGELSVAELTRRVTERYVGVRREDDGTVQVMDGEGRSYPLSRLSRGTRDQIYLALRVGLAEAALETDDRRETGFLLLDDAFLTADWTRREHLVASMAELAEAGWQVIYLTCDDHLRDLFRQAGATLHEL